MPQLLSAGIQLIQALINGVLSLLGTLLSAAGTLISQMITKIGSYFGQLLASGGQLVENIKNGVTNAADQVKNAIGSVIEGAWQAIQGWFSKFTDAGANIVGMIADGITGAIGKAKEAIDGVVSKIRNFLPFSPAKEGPLSDLHKLNFGGTIATGIYAGETAVSRAMASILDLPLLNDFALDLAGRGNFTATIDHRLENDAYNRPLFVTVESTLDGKVVAATTAPYLATELQRQQVKQNNRLGRRG